MNISIASDEWNLTYLIHSRNDRLNIVPKLGFEPSNFYTLSDCLTYYRVKGWGFKPQFRHYVRLIIARVYQIYVKSKNYIQLVLLFKSLLEGLS